jgi:hypothetical protein
MNSMQAVYSIDGLLVRAALTLGASDSQILTRVVCRTALPTLVAGARIALGNAWTTLVAAELLAATAGLGYIALNASRTLEMGILLVGDGDHRRARRAVLDRMHLADALGRAVGARRSGDVSGAATAVAPAAARVAPARQPALYGAAAIGRPLVAWGLATAIPGLVPRACCRRRSTSSSASPR